MLGKEAFALLVTRVWNMLSDNEKFSADVSTSVNKLKPKAFRENVARSVLQAMTSAVGRTLTPGLSNLVKISLRPSRLHSRTYRKMVARLNSRAIPRTRLPKCSL